MCINISDRRKDSLNRSMYDANVNNVTKNLTLRSPSNRPGERISVNAGLIYVYDDVTM